MLIGWDKRIQDCLGVAAHDDPDSTARTPNVRHAISPDDFV
jgi:hypothetical protein